MENMAKPSRHKRYSYICIAIIISVIFFPTKNFSHAQTEGIRNPPLTLSVGDITTIQLKDVASRINIGTSDVVGLFMGEKRLLVVRAKSPGFTNLFVQYESGEIEQYNISVTANYTLDVLAQELQKYMKSLGDIDVCTKGEKIILQGNIENKDSYLRYKQIILMYKDDVVDNVRYGAKGKELSSTESESTQVQIDVKVVQIIHTDSSNLGIEWFGDGPWSISAKGSIDYENPGDVKYSGLVDMENVNFRLSALIKEGKAKFLATPKLVVQSGKQANFLVGGEIPIAQINAVSSEVEWKKYGTELYIAPTVRTNTEVFISMQASVSDLDHSNAIGGFPALRTRSTDTNITIHSGSTFAIAGFLGYEISDAVSKVPLLGDIPVIGKLFSSKSKKLTQIETIIFITPHILIQSKAEKNTPIKSNIIPGKQVELLMSKDISVPANNT